MNRLALYQYNTLYHSLHATPTLRSLTIRPHGLVLTHPVQTLPEIPGLECQIAWGHTRLEVLWVHTIGPAQTKYMFTFPSLQIIDMQCLQAWAAVELFDSLLEFIPQGRAPIRQIRLGMITVHPTLVLETFTDTLESLEISNCDGLDDDIFESLSLPITGTEGSLLCPRLRDLNFSGIHNLKAGPLVRLIKVRLPSSNFSNPCPPTPIRNLVINDCTNIDVEALPWMRANVLGVLCYVSKERMGVN
ncbi:hypothetical protein FS749_009144 [Ceratobasidium sp. UAMH 11750]|nr:hypothetical protein FS749_009144 [Ceratobasidium sp. UAMH 11750]